MYSTFQPISACPNPRLPSLPRATVVAVAAAAADAGGDCRAAYRNLGAPLQDARARGTRSREEVRGVQPHLLHALVPSWKASTLPARVYVLISDSPSRFWLATGARSRLQI
uniref:Uncharacterized protein n=1 Tax=Setaria viridis TaxID=4556 RepID=A0A4V6D8R5_SETVI|nr:hypothetical protein SEVIR_4G251600v2 [Setaria viridis]